ncbi:MAG: HEAT repeat domain-containing protein, partial [Planctomycetes bacterium]|nr:HEAT repeat domain-containing protein [Planctomycetota bacterium]
DPLADVMEKGDDPMHRGYCALAMGMIGKDSSVKPLKKLLRTETIPQVRSQAALALAQLRDTTAVSELIDFLIESDNDTTKAFVALSLAYMGDLQIVDQIHNIMQMTPLDDLTLSYCISLSTRLLSGQPKPYLSRVAAGSNFACEYPMVSYLLDFGL